MDAVLLDSAGNVDQVLVDHGNKGDMVPCSESTEDLVEGLYVVRPVVWRQGDAGQQDLDVRGFERGKHLVKIASRLVEREAAQPVVAAKLDDDNFWMKPQDGRKTDDSVLGCGSAGTLIYDLVVIAL